jgi:N,N'-diacetyllegionaminate synthase
MKIGRRDVGSPAGEVYIIAEIGVNHDGSPERAMELVRAARDAGADAVKFQVFRADLLMSRAARLADYQASAGERDPVAMLRRLELPFDALRSLVDGAHALGLDAVATVFSLELVDEAAALAWDAFKTASPDIVHRPLLLALAGTGRPIIVSTGASTLEEVRRAVDWLEPWRERTALLQCVSAYPVADDDAALDGIAAIGRVFAGPVGYSDHTQGTGTGASAVRWGAAILEKHLTYDRGAAGPDHAASLDPAMFARYASAARAARPDERGRSVMGVKRVLDVEMDVRGASRQSIVVRRALGAGHVLTRDDLTFKRPGSGLEPWQLEGVLGARLSTAVPADTPLTIEAVRGSMAGPGRRERGAAA